MIEKIELVFGHRERTQRVVPILKQPFQQARDLCAARLSAADIEVHVVDAPEECIPEIGLGGYAFGPHSLVLAVDPDHAIQPSDVLSTLVHEIHHAMRWRGPGCGSSLAERLVSEGLAQVFEYECTGTIPLYARGNTQPEHRALATKSLAEDPANEGRWFFGAGDLPRWFGYCFGFELVSDAIEAGVGGDAASLVHEPAKTFVQRLRRAAVGPTT